MNKINYIFLFFFSVTQSCVTYSMQTSDPRKRQEERRKQFKQVFAILYNTQTVITDVKAFENYVSPSYYDENSHDTACLSCIQYELRAFTPVLFNGYSYRSLFHELLVTGNREGIRLLIANKPRSIEYLNRVSFNEKSPLATAIDSEHYEIAHDLIDAGVDITHDIEPEHSALKLALQKGNPELVSKFIAHRQFKPGMITSDMNIHGDVYELVRNTLDDDKDNAPQAPVQNRVKVKKLSVQDDDWNW